MYVVRGRAMHACGLGRARAAPCRPTAGPQVAGPAPFSKRTKFQSKCTKAYENFAGLQNDLAKKNLFLYSLIFVWLVTAAHANGRPADAVSHIFRVAPLLHFACDL